jgi:hypothetical protein
MVNCHTQILNIDRSTNDSISESWYLLISGSVILGKQNKDLVDISNYSEFVEKV